MKTDELKSLILMSEYNEIIFMIGVTFWFVL